ncbi:efflux RND transporter permease subunit [Patescibacteria group bacterium]|nr:efflux RND transporter permease subunit [Patescibacteria group bacterium]
MKEEQSSYLKQLKFDPKLYQAWIAKYLFNLRFIILIVVAILGFGVYSYLNLPRNINPDIKLAYVVVSAVLPGASPNDIESLVTIPLEDSIQSIQGIDLLQSTSRDSVSLIVVQFKTGVDADKARTDVQSAVDSVNTLPSDAQVPKVTKLDFENQPLWSFDLTGEGDSASLLRFAQDLKTSLDNIPSINKVVISGLEEQEIQILLKPEVISTYNLNPQQITGIIKSSLNSLPAGSVKTDKSSFALTIDPAAANVDDLRHLKLNLNDQIVSLGDIAIISQRSKPDQAISYLVTPGSKPLKAVSFDIYRNTTYKIDTVISEARKTVDGKISQNHQFKIYSVTDIGQTLADQFHDLLRDFTLTVILVATILFIFLGVRQAAVASAAIPLTFLITFIVMNATGVALSFISTFSLLLSLGLLVDDTIVIVSAMTAYYRSKKFTPQQTGLLVWKDFLIPVLTTTTTTVWAFLPILISKGIIGEFIKPIPIVVSSTLIASIFVALMITLPVMVFLLKPKIPFRTGILLRIILFIAFLTLFWLIVPKSKITFLEVIAFLIFLFVTFQARKALVTKLVTYLKSIKGGKKFINRAPIYLDLGVISFQRLANFYKRVIQRILRSPSARKKTVIMVVVFSLFSFALFPLGLVKSEFFPKTEADYLQVSVELPTGTNLEQSNAEALRLAEEVKGIPEINFVIADIGRTTSLMPGSGGETNKIQLSVELKKANLRKKHSFKIADLIRQRLAGYSKGKVLVSEPSGGPPAGADIQIKLFGEDLTVLDNYSNKVEAYLNKQPGVANIDKSIKPGTSKLVFVPDPIKLTQNDLTFDQVGYWLRLYASGFTADTIKLPEDNNLKKDISIRLNSQSQKAQDLMALNIRTSSGPIPLSSLGTVKLEPNPTLITREDRKRTISVTASVTGGYSRNQINAKLADFAKTDLNLPSGYSWSTGGANEENQKSTLSVLQAMLISFVLIIVTMVVQFNSFRKALIVMLVIPLSISGVFVLFALTQTYLTFPALIGVLALFGIVVKNSILLMDKIIANEKAGMEFTESVSDAAASRLEAIALTSIATIAGLVPITLSNPLWRGLGGAIIAGLTFSGTTMLFFIPVVYYLIFKGSEGKRR